jgi:hypothetical protein
MNMAFRLSGAHGLSNRRNTRRDIHRDRHRIEPPARAPWAPGGRRARRCEGARRGGVSSRCRVASILGTRADRTLRRADYANGAVMTSSERSLTPPDALLAAAQGGSRRSFRQAGAGGAGRRATYSTSIIIACGRRRMAAGDCSGRSPGLIAAPHAAYRRRDFVLRPAAQIAPRWRDPLSGLTIAQLHHRATRA